MQSGTPYGRDFCGARTRAGGECRSRPVRGRKRCRMHGGASLRGPLHPNYRHGLRARGCLFSWLDQRKAADERRDAALRRALDRELAKLPAKITFEQFAEAVRRSRRWYAQRCMAARRPKLRRKIP